MSPPTHRSPIHTVTHDSPPRYVVHNADSDEEDDREPIERDVVTSIVRRALEGSEELTRQYRVYLEVSFKPPKGPDRSWKRQRIDYVPQWRVLAERHCVECTFRVPEETPVFFMNNYKNRWSKLSVFCEGPGIDHSPVLFQNHGTYLHHLNEPEEKLCSLDLQADLTLAPLTDSMRERLGLLTSTVARRLFWDEDDAMSQTRRGPRVERGAIVSLREVSVRIPSF